MDKQLLKRKRQMEIEKEIKELEQSNAVDNLEELEQKLDRLKNTRMIWSIECIAHDYDQTSPGPHHKTVRVVVCTKNELETFMPKLPDHHYTVVPGVIQIQMNGKVVDIKTVQQLQECVAKLDKVNASHNTSHASKKLIRRDV